MGGSLRFIPTLKGRVVGSSRANDRGGAQPDAQRSAEQPRERPEGPEDFQICVGEEESVSRSSRVGGDKFRGEQL